MPHHHMTRKEKQKYWKSHIEAWLQSNLSQAEYCRRQNLPLKSFRYRKRRLSSLQKQNQSFVPVKIQTDPVITSDLEPALRLVLHNGVKIEVADNFNSCTLQKLIRTVEAV